MKKLHKIQIISELVVTTPLTTITLLMRNFIANFVRILGICKTFAGKRVNQLGNIPRRGVVPKFSDIEVVALSITAEAFNFDSENFLFHRLHNECKDDLPHLISRKQFNGRRKSTARLAEEIRKEVAYAIDGSEDVFCIDSKPVKVCQNARARRCAIGRDNIYAAPDWGYCASQGLHYYGYKLHAVCGIRGVIHFFDMTAASVHDLRGGDFGEDAFGYDLQGNILTLTRQGLIAPDLYGRIDDLTATLRGNQLVGLRDDADDVLLESSLDLRGGDFGVGAFGYDRNGNQTRDMSRGVADVAYNVLNLPQRVEMEDGSAIAYTYSASGAKLTETVISPDGNRVTARMYKGPFEVRLDSIMTPNGLSRLVPRDTVIHLADGYLTMTDTVFHAYIADYQGNITGVYNTRTAALEQFTDYYPYGMPHAMAVASSCGNRRKFGGKELTTDCGLNLYDFEARWMNAALGSFISADLFSDKFISESIYSYCINDPIGYIDPFGTSPVYSDNGRFLGTTKEGFTGEILIYSGYNKDVDFSLYSQEETQKVFGRDIALMSDVVLKLPGWVCSEIWTHVVSYFNGTMIYDLQFDINTIENSSIGYRGTKEPAKSYIWGTKNKRIPPYITGSGYSNYEFTVENIASAIIIHEWYSHAMKKVSDAYKSHRLAYQAVINDPVFWDKTTYKYKRNVLLNLLLYTFNETGRRVVDFPYRRIYDKIVNYGQTN